MPLHLYFSAKPVNGERIKLNSTLYDKSLIHQAYLKVEISVGSILQIINYTKTYTYA